jgi:AbrB family looped-hinge helix DNA binding protein
MPKVTQKGQVTIPHQIRSLLSIKTGDEVIFQIDKKRSLDKKH